MSNLIYLLRYPDGPWVKRDDSTGPMSTGGYPMKVNTIKDATFWYDKAGALKYAHVLKNEKFILYQFEVLPAKADVSPGELAKAAGDEEYLEYLRLARKYGGEDAPKCKFDIAWAGRCKQLAEVGEEFCSKHLEDKCFKCGRQAVKDCGHTSQFVCGMPECADHSHHGGGF